MSKHAAPCLLWSLSMCALACTSRAPLTHHDDAFVPVVDVGLVDMGVDAFVRDVGPVDPGPDAFAPQDAGADVGHDAGRCRSGAHVGLYAADDLAAHQTVHDFLVPTGVLASVAIGGPVEDVVGPPMVPARIPTLSELMQYDAVFVWGSGSWNGDAFGDVLADYVDRGGGVVIAVFGQRQGAVTGVAGRMLSAGYLPYVPSNYQFLALTLGAVALPMHPIMQGVHTFSGSNIANHDGPIAGGATLVASWSNGTPLAAVMQPSAGRTALLGVYPVRFWDTSSDGARMMANTLLWAARCQ